MSWYKRAMPVPAATGYPTTKQGPNSSISIIDQKMTQTEADEINRQHNPMHYVGHGAAGIAYQNGDPNTIIKLTRYQSEAKNAYRLMGKDIPCCVKVFDVHQVAQQGVWQITLERVRPLSEEEIEIFDLFFMYGRKSLSYLTDNYEKSLVKKYFNEYDQLRKCLHANGVADADAQGDNLGRKSNGQLCLLDVG